MYELLCRYLLGFLEHGEEDLNGGLQVQGRVAGVVLQGLHPALLQYSKNINLDIFYIYSTGTGMLCVENL